MVHQTALVSFDGKDAKEEPGKIRDAFRLACLDQVRLSSFCSLTFCGLQLILDKLSSAKGSRTWGQLGKDFPKLEPPPAILAEMFRIIARLKETDGFTFSHQGVLGCLIGSLKDPVVLVQLAAELVKMREELKTYYTHLRDAVVRQVHNLLAKDGPSPIVFRTLFGVLHAFGNVADPGDAKFAKYTKDAVSVCVKSPEGLGNLFEIVRSGYKSHPHASEAGTAAVEKLLKDVLTEQWHDNEQKAPTQFLRAV